VDLHATDLLVADGAKAARGSCGGADGGGGAWDHPLRATTGIDLDPLVHDQNPSSLVLFPPMAPPPLKIHDFCCGICGLQLRGNRDRVIVI